jgi:hypothetical protein
MNIPPIIRFLGGRLAVYLLAVAIAYLLASATATQAVIASLAGMGLQLGWGDRLDMTLRDLRGMASMFLPMVAFGMLAAFLTAALLCRWLPRGRAALYALAGAAALVMIHVLLKLAFGITPVAVARTGGGLALQAVAGAVGGVLYWQLGPGRERRG